MISSRFTVSWDTKTKEYRTSARNSRTNEKSLIHQNQQTLDQHYLNFVKNIKENRNSALVVNTQQIKTVDSKDEKQPIINLQTSSDSDNDLSSRISHIGA